MIQNPLPLRLPFAARPNQAVSFGASLPPATMTQTHGADSIHFSGKKLPRLTYEKVATYDVDYLGRVNQYRFSNGLEAYIIQDPDAEDLVSYGVAVKTGSINETEATNGGSHFFEHEIFKGTHQIGPMKAPRILQALGSGVNAYTSNDVTFYYGYEFEKPALKSVISLWAEMLLNHAFPEAELNRERGVVIEEIKRSHNNKQNQLYYKLLENVWADSRYRRTVLGPIRNIANMPVEKFKEYYAQHYGPDNQAAVAIGNFSEADMTGILDTLAEEYAQTFDAVPARKLPPLPPRQGDKNVLLRENVRISIMRQGFDGPIPGTPAADKEIIALDLLTNILGGGQGGRLHQQLVEAGRLANGTSIGMMINGQRSMVTLSAQCDPQNLEAVKTAVREQIDRIIAEGVTDEELEQARIVTENEYASVNENQRVKLNMVGKLVAQGRLQKTFGNQVELASQITSEDIQAAARKYLGADQAFTVAMVPKDHPVQPYETATKAKKGKGVRFGGSLGPQDKSELLPGGTELVVREKPGTQKKTAISLVLKGGNRSDEIPGVSDLLALMLERGTERMSASELQKRLGARQLNLGFSSHTDSIVLTMNGLKQFTPEMFELLGEIVQSPRFSEEDLAFVKKQFAGRIQNALDTNAQYKLSELATQTLYGDNHPYGHTGSRILKHLDEIGIEDIRAAYRRLFTQGNITIGVVGDTTLEAVREPASKLVEKFPEGAVTIPDAPPAAFEREGVVAEIDNSLSQAEIRRVWYAPDVKHEDGPAFRALDYILSGGFARLFMTFRESGEKGLAYTATTDYTPRQQGGSFEFYIGTSPENISKVLGMFQNEVDLLLNSPVPAQELEDQLTFLKARLKAGMQSPAATSAKLAGHRSGDTPSTEDLLKEIEHVTAEDVLRVARKYLARPSTTVVIAPEKDLREHKLI